MQTEFDVIVCGGGFAGIAAALSAARCGAKTCLLEKEYALGGLATLGLIVMYLPMCDGDGVKMSGSIGEELALCSIKYGPGKVPEAWANPNADSEARSKQRYQIRYEAAPFMIAAEELLLDNGVTIYYDARLADVTVRDGEIKSITVDTKRGGIALTAKSYVDATGDADLCYFSGERTAEYSDNSRTGWYFSYDAKEIGRAGTIKLHANTDPYYPHDPSKPRYTGLDLDDISRHMIDMRRYILADVQKQRAENPDIYPFMIPAFHGLRTTRRLSTSVEFSDERHNQVWFDDTVGMIGNWKKRGGRYCIPYRAIKGELISNIYAAGRCVSADRSGWDLTRVIPSCSVTGEAAGIAAAIQSVKGKAPEAADIQTVLIERGAPLDRSLFGKTEADL